MYIRQAQPNDLDGLIRLLQQVGEVHHQGRPDLFKTGAQKYNESQLLALIHDENRPIFVAVDDQEWMLGYAFCIVQQHLHDPVLTDIRTLYIDDLCVDEHHRGQHIGKALYDYVIAYANEQKFYNVTLNVWGFNDSAMRFYESCGLTTQKIGLEKIL